MTARRTQKKYGTDPELDRYCIRLPFSPAMLIPARPAMRAMYALTPTPRGVRHTVVHSGSLRLDVFEPLARVRGLPCLIYMHGGGFGYMAAPYHKKLAAVYAREVGCRVVCPDYRLVPRHPYPAAREDCLAALEWVEEKYPGCRLAVGGDSAGAALATYLVAAKPQGLCFQLLVYPVCSAAGDSDSVKRYRDTPLWDSRNNSVMWRLYLAGRDCPDADPMRARLPEMIPDTYIELAEYDCLHDEGAEYAERLTAAGAAVTVADTRGTFHGYDIAMNARVTRESIARRIGFMHSHFQK